MKRILIVSTVSRQFHLFERTNIEALTSLGWEVHAAANYRDANGRHPELDIKHHHIDIQRSPLSLSNCKALYQLSRLIRTEHIDAIHCHSPVGGALARIAGALHGVHPIIYTAHGFHFYSGAPIVNWILFYPLERLLAKFTDAIITINEEDFARAQTFKNSGVYRTPGVGVNTEAAPAYIDSTRGHFRRELGIPSSDLLIISVGELNRNKNHEAAIKALAELPDLHAHYVICGRGSEERRLREMVARLGLADHVKLLGFRGDVPQLLAEADILVHPSLREGLPVSVIEAMSAGLPCVVSDIRGNRDLIEEEIGGYRVPPKDYRAIAAAIRKLSDPTLRRSMSQHNRIAARRYSKTAVLNIMVDIYRSVLPAQGGRRK